MAIKYKYAWRGEKAVHIDSVLPSDRKGEYTCMGCDKALLPALGNIRQHHFRHKVVANCSPETYLHRLAKEKFYETYKNCLDNGFPFLIDLSVVGKCIDYDQCKRPQKETHDLTEYFPIIDIETPHGKFIPDILLRSAKGVPLYIEIKVSHGCTQEKIDSGNKIIEIEINSEKDIEDLSKNRLTDLDNSIFFNFVRERLVPCLQKECDRQGSAFLVYSSGKSILRNKCRVSDLNRAIKHSVYFEWIDEGSFGNFLVGQIACDLYKKKNAEVFQKGIPVKNCYLCRYHSISFDDAGIYCKHLRRQTTSTFAAECDIFRPDIEVYQQYLEYFV